MQTEDITEPLEVCYKTTYFQVKDRFYQQKNNMAMESSLSPAMTVLQNILKNQP
jgi:hypothetical protein